MKLMDLLLLSIVAIYGMIFVVFMADNQGGKGRLRFCSDVLSEGDRLMLLQFAFVYLFGTDGHSGGREL
jgi:hypothetical protein